MEYGFWFADGGKRYFLRSGKLNSRPFEHGIELLVPRFREVRKLTLVGWKLGITSQTFAIAGALSGRVVPDIA